MISHDICPVPSRPGELLRSIHAPALNPLWRHVNAYLIRWMQRKYKHLRRHKLTGSCFPNLAASSRKAFVHWEWGILPVAR